MQTCVQKTKCELYHDQECLFVLLSIDNLTTTVWCWNDLEIEKILTERTALKIKSKLN